MRIRCPANCSGTFQSCLWWWGLSFRGFQFGLNLSYFNGEYNGVFNLRQPIKCFLTITNGQHKQLRLIKGMDCDSVLLNTELGLYPILDLFKVIDL